MRKFLSTIVFLVMMSGCQEMRISDFVGTWVMKEESRENLPIEVKKSIGKLTLAADGTFTAYELPDRTTMDGFGNYAPRWRIISGSGTWKFSSISGRQVLYLWFKKFSFENADDQDVSEGFPIEISKWWSTISLYYDLSDPDNWEIVEFEKVE